MKRPQIAISRCLLGEPVRYDGRDKHTPDLISAINLRCEILPVCPEVEAGFSIPRPPIQLVFTVEQALKVVGRDDPALDVTQPLQQMAHDFCSGHTTLSGAILQNRAPSCGAEDTPHYNSNGKQIAAGDGLFTQFLRTAYPGLPIETPISLSTPDAIEQFLQQASSYSALPRA